MDSVDILVLALCFGTLTVLLVAALVWNIMLQIQIGRMQSKIAELERQVRWVQDENVSLIKRLKGE